MGGKLDIKWNGPYIVKAKLTKGRYQLQSSNGVVLKKLSIALVFSKSILNQVQQIYLNDVFSLCLNGIYIACIRDRSHGHTFPAILIIVQRQQWHL